MRRAAAVRARQRKLREENANQETDSVITSEDSTPASATNTKGGRNRKGGVSKQQESNAESDDRGVENKEGQSVDGDSSEEQYEVEKIVDMKVIRGVRKYRIRWKGYDSESDTWEAADNLNCPNAVQEYLDQNSNKSEEVSVTSGRKRANKADVVAEEAATNNVENTEKDITSKDEGEEMPPVKKRKSSKVAKPAKNDESADDENEEEENEEKVVEPPAKKRKSTKVVKPAKNDESADDENEEEEEENEEKTVEPPSKKRKSTKVAKPAKNDDESADDENEEEEQEEAPVKEETAKISRTKAKGKKEETVSGEETENGVDTDETSYEVEKIMEVHHKKNGKKEYLIHWRGYPHSQDTWEPEENLDCEELIREFEERVNKAKNLNVRELRTERVHTSRYAEEQSAKRQSKRGKGKKRTTYYDTE